MWMCVSELCVCVYMKVCICGVLHESLRVYVVCMFACMCECAVCVCVCAIKCVYTPKAGRTVPQVVKCNSTPQN